MLTIGLEEMQFVGTHGVFQEEGVVSNEFLISVYVSIQEPSVPAHLDDTIDYGRIYALISEVLQTPQALMEQLAIRCVDCLLEAFPSIAAVDFKIAKKQPPIIGLTGNATVRITRTLHDSDEK